LAPSPRRMAPFGGIRSVAYAKQGHLPGKDQMRLLIGNRQPRRQIRRRLLPRRSLSIAPDARARATPRQYSNTTNRTNTAAAPSDFRLPLPRPSTAGRAEAGSTSNSVVGEPSNSEMLLTGYPTRRTRHIAFSPWRGHCFIKTRQSAMSTPSLSSQAEPTREP
jgi:hypothetical protein